MSDLIWSNEQRKLSDLIPWDINPRTINDDHAKRLIKSREEFGQTELLLIGPDNELYNGHQRTEQWANEYGGDLLVDVRVSNRSMGLGNTSG